MGDLTSWLGIALQTLAIIITVGAFVLRIHLDVKLLVQRQEHMQDEQERIQSKLEALNQVLIDLTKQDARLTNIEFRMQELSIRLTDHIKAGTL